MHTQQPCEPHACCVVVFQGVEVFLLRMNQPHSQRFVWGGVHVSYKILPLLHEARGCCMSQNTRAHMVSGRSTVWAVTREWTSVM